MKKRITALGLLPLICACSDDSGQDMKNVLFIMVDDLKPNLGCYGDPMAITPAIDRLAEDGILYSRAYCQQALSGPSRASILTGLRPEEVGVTELNTWMRQKNPDVITIPQAFREAGYETRGVGKIFHGDRNSLDSLSWSCEPSLYSYTRNEEYMLPVNRTGKKAAACEFTEGPENGYFDVRIRNRAIEELTSLAGQDKPFFLAVGFLKPHLPFCAPRRFMDMYDDMDMTVDTERIAGAPELAYHDSNELRGYTDIPSVGDITPGQHEYLKKAYYACTSFTDENIGLLLEELRRLGLHENTVVVLVGDHGYHTGEQGLWCKSTNYEAACRAPLIIYDPDGKGNGQRVDTVVELIDIFPTLGKTCGIGIPENLSGKDLGDLDPDKEYCAYSQFPRPYGALHKRDRRTHMGYAVRNDKWTGIKWYDNDGNLTDTELYYMKNYDMETTNLNYRNTTLIMEKLMDNPYYAAAMEYIRTHDLSEMENGTYRIDGDNLYVNIVDSNLRPAEKAKLEVHDRYIDIQIPLSDSETFGLRPRSSCMEPAGDMNTERDIQFFNDSFDRTITVAKGEVVTFAPEEAHAPLIGDGKIRKAIFKVLVTE